MLWAYGHKSTTKPYDKLKTVASDETDLVYRFAAMFARRDDDSASKFERGKIKSIDKRRRYQVHFFGPEGNEYPEPYVETVRAGSLRAVRNDAMQNNSFEEGAEVFAKFDGIWTEKVYLRFWIHQNPEVQGFFYYCKSHFYNIQLHRIFGFKKINTPTPVDKSSTTRLIQEISRTGFGTVDWQFKTLTRKCVPSLNQEGPLGIGKKPLPFSITPCHTLS